MAISGVPLKFTALLENQEAAADESVTFSCQLTKPGEQVTWFKDNEPLLLTEERYQMVNMDCSYQLVIPKVTVEDCGEYMIKVGDLQSTAVLTVNGL